MFGKVKYVAMFLKKNNNSYDVLKQRRIKDKELRLNAVTYAGKTYLIDTSNISYSKGRKHFIIIDVDRSQLSLLEQKMEIPAEVIDNILNRSIITQFASALSTAKAGQLFPIVVGVLILVAGALIGYFAGSIAPIEEVSEALKGLMG